MVDKKLAMGSGILIRECRLSQRSEIEVRGQATIQIRVWWEAMKSQGVSKWLCCAFWVPKYAVGGCPDKHWGAICSSNMIQKTNESLLMTMGLTHTVILLQRFYSIFKWVCSLIFLFPKGNIIDSFKNVSPDIVMCIFDTIAFKIITKHRMAFKEKWENTLLLLCANSTRCWSFYFYWYNPENSPYHYVASIIMGYAESVLFSWDFSITNSTWYCILPIKQSLYVILKLSSNQL